MAASETLSAGDGQLTDCPTTPWHWHYPTFTRRGTEVGSRCQGIHGWVQYFRLLRGPEEMLNLKNGIRRLLQRATDVLEKDKEGKGDSSPTGGTAWKSSGRGSAVWRPVCCLKQDGNIPSVGLQCSRRQGPWGPKWISVDVSIPSSSLIPFQSGLSWGLNHFFHPDSEVLGLLLSCFYFLAAEDTSLFIYYPIFLSFFLVNEQQ